MRIGLLTFHEGLNHGAYLQAFATMRVLQKQGHDVEIINYKNREHWMREDVRPWRAYRRPVRFLDHWQKMRSFKRDHAQMTLSPFTTQPSDIEKRHYDVVVIGSDVVWNYKIFGYDDLYFGGVSADRIISYAPSFGWVNFGEEHPVGVAEGIRSFDAVSVRDENSRKIVESITGHSPEIVLDPTLIYDFSEDETNTPRIDKLDRYIMVYCYVSDPEIIAKVKAFAQDQGLPLISVGYRQFWCDKTLMDVGPMEWLGLYRKATYVVSSTFHGTIFSLKYRKEFLYIKNEKAHNRIVSLAAACGLQDAFFASEERVVFIRPNYKDVELRLAPLIDASRTWLLQSLRGNSEI